ncbi:hypothetical protein SELMODRAFT_270469 [Selaginella moellendorffii]|uniref:Uncharacterized protein n=1 Tax=Selaginella moellendorffii TaxID=88036 RepID=D8R1Q5_SELML|nr:uncharacterized protein LOC9658465 [Selaginella moellendorffii]EFJ33595.1 hypothetical protein SELMODRAFT_270469 [Selaginella moellendorffii]|eukprot:XP_024525239.1 uncharacterized protein LOC9658465 [Selaginella moellendorffii]
MRLVLALSFALWLSLAIVFAVESDDKGLGAVLEATDKIVQQLGWKREDVNVSRVYSRRMGQALMYEFDIEIGGNIFPIKLAEDISTWRYVDELSNHGTDKAMVEFGHWDDAALAPFKIAGPVELWIQDAKDLRLAIPNDVDAGALRKVLLADGATVTVLGAREISLTKPFKVPLPLVGSGDDHASSILALSEQLRQASRSSDRPILSLRVVKPSSLVASAPEQLDSPPERLKVKKLSPGAVELSSRALDKLAGGEIELSGGSSSGKSQWLWPLPSVNTSGPTLRSLEQALKLLLGPSAHRPGSFSLLRAKAAAAKFVKVEFELEKRLDGDDDALPEWATRPTIQRLQFEVLSKIDGDKVIPMSVRPLETYPSATTASFDFFSGNTTSLESMASTFLPPVSPLTLDVSW